MSKDGIKTKRLKMPPVVTVHSLSEYVAAVGRIAESVREINESTGDLLSLFFRGQANEAWRLLPRLFGRQFATIPFQYDARKWHDGADYWRSRTAVEIIETIGECANVKLLSRELAIAQEFMNEYHELFDDKKNWLDRLAVLQHCGVPTRLLDITSSALVALFFAVSECVEKGEQKDGVVHVFPISQDELDWSIRHDEEIGSLCDPHFWQHRTFRSACSATGIKISRSAVRPIAVSPKSLTERQKRQRGRFFLFPNRIVRNGAISDSAGKIDLEWQTKILISEKDKSRIKSELGLAYGLNAHYLFPEDVDGYARDLVARAKAIANDKTGIIM